MAEDKTLRQALQDAATAEPAYDVYIPELHKELFGYSHSNFNDDESASQIIERYISSWMCTDTLVGLAALFLNGELIGYTWQSARKSDKIYKFLSKEARDKLKAIVAALRVEDSTLVADENLVTQEELDIDISHILRRNQSC